MRFLMLRPAGTDRRPPEGGHYDRRSVRLLAGPALAFLVLGAAVVATAQTQQPPVFRAAAELVEVIVRVTDLLGNMAAGKATFTTE